MTESEIAEDAKTAMHDYLISANLAVDRVFGSGFAAEHPEIVGMAALTCSIEYLTMSGLLKVSDAIVALGIDSSIQLRNANDEYWRVSQLAAKDKAKELGITIKPEWDINDLRYKIDYALRGVGDE